MKLVKAQVQNYRSVQDTGIFDIEKLKTILVGPNEAGKTVVLQALQQLKKPTEIPSFDPLRDYPRSEYSKIFKKEIDPADVPVVTGYFVLEDSEKDEVDDDYKDLTYVFVRYLDNHATHRLDGAPSMPSYNDLKPDLIRLTAHMDKQYDEDSDPASKPSNKLTKFFEDLSYPASYIRELKSKELIGLLEGCLALVDEDNAKEVGRFENLIKKLNLPIVHANMLKLFDSKIPVFVLFNNYFKVKPTLHLEHLAQRVEQNILDDDYYDYGNLCLLKLLGFEARELANIGNTQSPKLNQAELLKEYTDNLDRRTYQLNSASVTLTKEIRSIWMPNPNRPEADKLRVSVDGQYLKVVVEDELGVEIELDQRSEGFQWLVSFFVVFFAEAMDKHENAILLLDEPGMSLHGLKQCDFRSTLSRLAQENQVIYTTHSPFLVGPDELDLVRVVELKTRAEGTKVHTCLSSSDPAGLLPLQEALGYDLASSLFGQQKNFILEGLTDYWYVNATSLLMEASGLETLDPKTALVFANSAGKVVYYATILHAQNLKVAALLDSDAAGDQAANQESLIHTLGNNKILRTKDFCGASKMPEIEDLVASALIEVVKDEYGIDVLPDVEAAPEKSIVKIISSKVPKFSKYKLAKLYLKWTQDHTAEDLSKEERESWAKLFKKVNSALK